MAQLIPVFIMGKKYEVLEGLTILKAFEYAGYQVIRGCGCRAGACGACSTIYRVAGDYELKVGLACQTPVLPNMYLTQIPFFPIRRPAYELENMKENLISSLYPEIKKCLGCNSCGHVCPQNLVVMDFIRSAQKNHIEKTAHLSFECLMCGLCASRCPVNIAPFQAGMLARRLYSRFYVQKSALLKRRCDEIRTGKYKEAVSKMRKVSLAELKKMYDTRDIVKKKF